MGKGRKFKDHVPRGVAHDSSGDKEAYYVPYNLRPCVAKGRDERRARRPQPTQQEHPELTLSPRIGLSGLDDRPASEYRSVYDSSAGNTYATYNPYEDKKPYTSRSRYRDRDQEDDAPGAHRSRNRSPSFHFRTRYDGPQTSPDLFDPFDSQPDHLRFGQWKYIGIHEDGRFLPGYDSDDDIPRIDYTAPEWRPDMHRLLLSFERAKFDKAVQDAGVCLSPPWWPGLAGEWDGWNRWGSWGCFGAVDYAP